MAGREGKPWVAGSGSEDLLLLRLELLVSQRALFPQLGQALQQRNPVVHATRLWGGRDGRGRWRGRGGLNARALRRGDGLGGLLAAGLSRLDLVPLDPEARRVRTVDGDREHHARMRPPVPVHEALELHGPRGDPFGLDHQLHVAVLVDAVTPVPGAGDDLGRPPDGILQVRALEELVEEAHATPDSIRRCNSEPLLGTGHALLRPEAARTIAGMFGHKDEVETTATVVAVSQESKYAEQNAKYKVVLDVNGVGEPVFRTSVEQRFLTLLQAPNPGDVVNVRYDRKHHEVEMLVKCDPRFDAEAAQEQRDQQQAAAVEAAMAQPPGSPPPAGAAPGIPGMHGGFPMAGLPTVVQTSRQVIDATHVPGLREAIVAALQAHGIQVPNLAKMAEGETPTPPSSASAVAVVPAAAAPTDPQGRIPHLKMLRDSGLLTADEYGTLEAKLLGRG